MGFVTFLIVNLPQPKITTRARTEELLRSGWQWPVYAILTSNSRGKATATVGGPIPWAGDAKRALGEC